MKNLHRFKINETHLYGMMSDSFDFSGFFNKHVLSGNFTFSMASTISFNGYFRFSK